MKRGKKKQNKEERRKEQWRQEGRMENKVNENKVTKVGLMQANCHPKRRHLDTWGKTWDNVLHKIKRSEDTGNTCHLQSKERCSWRSKICWHFGLVLSIPTTVRNKFLSFKQYNLWHLVVVVVLAKWNRYLEFLFHEQLDTKVNKQKNHKIY